MPFSTNVVSSNPAHGLRQVRGFLRVPHQYNWNIVESGVMHHNPNQNINYPVKKDPCPHEESLFRSIDVAYVFNYI